MKVSKQTLQESVLRQREQLLRLLEQPMQILAEEVKPAWISKPTLDDALEQRYASIPNCTYLYAVAPDGVQITDTFSAEGRLEEDYARDRSIRPYMQQITPGTQFLLSEAYISTRKNRPSVSAIQSVFDEAGHLMGYIGADFDLRDLPITREMYVEPHVWQQIKGDPSIRRGVFSQQRVESLLDADVNTVIGVLTELMQNHGVYHIMLHFSSSRSVIWHYDDPYQYRLLGIDALTDPDVCLAFPQTPYPDNASIPSDKIGDIMSAFQSLRYMDDTLYLRTGTVNIFNGIIGLTFSCDGSHYIPWNEFLDREHAIWSSGAP